MVRGRTPDLGAVFMNAGHLVKACSLRKAVGQGAGKEHRRAGTPLVSGAASALSLGLLCLTGPLAFVAVFRLHMSSHGRHAGCRETVSAAGHAHLIVLTDVVIQCFVICRPESTQGTEVGVHSPAWQLLLCPGQSCGRM